MAGFVVLSSAAPGLFAAGQLPPISLVSLVRYGWSVGADIGDQLGPIRVVSWGRNTHRASGDKYPKV